jgi:zinc protease
MIPKKETVGSMDFFFEQDRSVPLVYIYIDFLTGTDSDPEGKSGRIRLAAHMLKMGTMHKSREELNRAIESLGADMDLAATYHHVSLSAHMVSDSFDAFSDVLREVLHEPSMRREDFDKLRRETVADIIEARQDDQSIAYRNFRSLLFREHAYGRRNAGRRRELEELGFEETAALYAEKLRKSRLVVGGAGDIDRDRFIEKMTPLLEGLSSQELPPSDPGQPGAPSGLTVRLVDKPDRTQSQIYMGHLGPHAWNEDYFPTVVLNTAFGGTFTARLSQEIRRNRGMSYGAYSRILRSRQRDAFYLWTFPSTEETAQCVRIQLEMLEALREKSITDEEFDFATRYLRNHFLFAVETAPLRVSLGMKEVSQNLPPGFFEKYREVIGGIDRAMVDRAADAFIDPRNMCVSILCSADRVRPALEQELKAFSPRIEVTPYDDD